MRYAYDRSGHTDPPGECRGNPIRKGSDRNAETKSKSEQLHFPLAADNRNVTARRL